jgi:hypothetical protein
MLTRVKEEKHQAAQTGKLMASQKRAEIEKINLRLQKLLDSFLDELIDRETYVAEKAKGMSQKKSLEEQSSALLKGRADWLEPCPRLQKSPWFLRKTVVGTRRILANWWSGARGGSRTHNLRLRRPTLYPIELRARHESNLTGRRGFAQMNLLAKTKRDGSRPSLCFMSPTNQFCGGVLGGGVPALSPPGDA